MFFPLGNFPVQSDRTVVFRTAVDPVKPSAPKARPAGGGEKRPCFCSAVFAPVLPFSRVRGTERPAGALSFRRFHPRLVQLILVAGFPFGPRHRCYTQRHRKVKESNPQDPSLPPQVRHLTAKILSPAYASLWQHPRLPNFDTNANSADPVIFLTKSTLISWHDIDIRTPNSTVAKITRISAP